MYFHTYYLCMFLFSYTYSNNGTSQASSGEEFSSRSSPVQLLSKAAKRRRRKRLHNEAVNGDGNSVDTEISSTKCGRTVDDSNNEYLDVSFVNAVIICIRVI